MNKYVRQMECLNSNLGFVSGSLSVIPAGDKNILLIGFSAARPLQTATMECMMHPEHTDQRFI